MLFLQTGKSLLRTCCSAENRLCSAGLLAGGVLCAQTKDHPQRRQKPTLIARSGKRAGMQRQLAGFQPAASSPRPSNGLMKAAMPGAEAISLAANYLVIAGLVVYGFMLLAEYHARGRWAKNVTGLLSGTGMLALAAGLLLTPRNAEVLLHIAQGRASAILIWISTGLLLAAIVAFGLITYSKPLRLWHERRIERDLNRELPKIP
jgi:hypothetical protein